MREGSVNSWLSQLAVGEYRFVETSFDDYPKLMRSLNPAGTKRPPEIRKFELTCKLFTAISNGDPQDVRFLVRVGRTK